MTIKFTLDIIKFCLLANFNENVRICINEKIPISIQEFLEYNFSCKIPKIFVLLYINSSTYQCDIQAVQSSPTFRFYFMCFWAICMTAAASCLMRSTMSCNILEHFWARLGERFIWVRFWVCIPSFNFTVML